MGGSQKSKRVTWPSDVNLCQVRLFSSGEPPLQVGRGIHDNHLAKSSRRVELDDSLPPGFEGIQPANMLKFKLSQVPLTTWRCPPRFEINSEWQVVAGEESKESEAQNQREIGVLEAIYTRSSAIPRNPAFTDVEDSIVDDDRNTPLVPVTPIEDKDAAMDTSFGSRATNNAQPSQSSANMNPHVNGLSATGVQPDIAAAAKAALASVISDWDQLGSVIDPQLLIQILTNPQTVAQLVATHGASSGVQNVPMSSSLQNMPASGVQIVAPSGTQAMPPSNLHNMPPMGTPYMLNPVSSAINRKLEPSTHSMASATGQFQAPPPTRTGSIPNLRPSLPSALPEPVIKDINYYKNLIQQHGGDRRDILPPYAHHNNQSFGTSQEQSNVIKSGHSLPKTREPLNVTKSRNSKPKTKAPCAYFNSARGCRNGAKCEYKHVTACRQRFSCVPDVQSAKRVKLDTGITGT